MPLAIIPKKQAQNDGVVVISGKEYQEYLELKTQSIPMVRPTKPELKAITRAEKEIKAGKFYPWEEVKNELANLHHRRSKKRT